MTVVSFHHASISPQAFDDLMILRCEQWIDANPAKVDADTLAILGKKQAPFSPGESAPADRALVSVELLAV
jgi:hypothetical protein